MRYSVEPDRPSMGNPSPDSKGRVRPNGVSNIFEISSPNTSP